MGSTSDSPTPIDTAEIEALMQRASRGPWSVRREENDTGAIHYDVDAADAHEVACVRSQLPHDARLIVAAVNALPALLAERKELLRSREWHMTASQRRKEQVAELRAQLAEAQAAQAHYDAWREVSARAQERAVAEAWEAAAQKCDAHKPGHTLDLDGRLVDDPDGPWGLGSDFAAAIRAAAPPKAAQ